MKFFKKTVSATLAVVMALCSNIICSAEENTAINYDFTASVQEIANKFVNEYPDMQEEILGTIKAVTEMPTYISAFEYDENMAYELLCDSIINLVSHSGVSTYGADYKGLFYANYTVPTVKQSTGYNCGIAAAIQAAIGNGFLTNTEANKSASMLTTAAGYVYYNENLTNGVQAWQVRTIMNHYEAGVYDAIPITRYSIDYILYDMENSFVKGYCPIITLTDTSKLGYYNGNKYNHWVTVSQIDDVHKTIMIVDPFNSDCCGGLASFGGLHMVTYDEFMDAIGVGGDCWLVLKTQYPDWAA